nr:class I SAM-dependent rRNA methyltransferase [Planctomycetota bacterium]
AYRNAVLPGADACRLINSEGDLLPGLIVDRYGDRLVVQVTTLGMERQLDAVLAALRELLAPTTIVERADAPVRAHEGLPLRTGFLHGADAAVTCRVGRARFALDLLDPHKTGFYLDQQANYALVAAHVRPGDRVLDTFCHLGGFAIHAALAGATSVLAVDSAAASIERAQAAAQLSGAGGIEFRCANAFDVLKAEQSSGARYDLIILDPPTFTRARDAVPGALRGYKELHLRALQMLPAGGRLATFSCSHHIGAELFLQSVLDAATDAKLTIRREAILAASPDHPVLPQIPETEYLKGFVFTVLETARK